MIDISPLKRVFKKYGMDVCSQNYNLMIDELTQRFSKSIMVLDGGYPFYIGLHEILYVDRPAKDFFIHTQNKVYKYHDRKIDLVDILSFEDNFEIVDKRLIVNIDNVKKYDSELRIMYFHPSASSEYPLVGYTHKFNSLLKNKLGREKDIVYDYKIK